MNLTADQQQAAAERIYAAERTREWTASVTRSHPDAGIDDAYRIAQAVADLKIDAGRRILGHKIGLTSKAMRALAGVDEPDYGALFDDQFVFEGEAIAAGELNQPRVEVELAFVLGADLSGPGVTAADVIRATDFVLPCLEIVDTRFDSWTTGTVVDSIADAASCGRVVLGGNPRRLDRIDIRRIGASLSRNGDIQQSGVASAVMGNPVTAVAWLANKLHEFGVSMRKGHVILSGSFVAAIPFAPGDTISALFDTFGEVSFRYGAAVLEGGAS